MKRAALLGAASTLACASCVNAADPCATGYRFVADLDYCAATDAGASDSGAAPSSTPPPADGGDAGGLGTSCNGPSDCTDAASYCLMSPTAPSAPGYCTIPGCSPGGCPASYVCCDCAASSIAALQSYPVACLGTASESEAVAFGCTCQ